MAKQISEIKNYIVSQAKKEKEIEPIDFLFDSTNQDDRLRIGFKSQSTPIEYKGKFICRIENKYSNLIKAVKSSFYILDLEDDFDDEGSLKYEYEIFRKAITFLVELNREVNSIHDLAIYAPEIYHGPSGSIDLNWEENGLRCLININIEGYSYYGKLSSGLKVEPPQRRPISYMKKDKDLIYLFYSSNGKV